MAPFTISTARTWLVLSGCDPEQVEQLLADFLDGLKDDRQCCLGEPGSEDVPVTDDEVRDLRIEVVLRTALLHEDELGVAMEFTTARLRERMRWPSLSTKRTQLHDFRHGRMVRHPDEE